MSANSSSIEQYLRPGRRAHLVGIGGVSMRPLGLVLRSMGMEITGSDMNASVATEELQRSGITVYIGHREENIEGADCVIRTAAAPTTGTFSVPSISTRTNSPRSIPAVRLPAI